ncbi:actin-related protein 9-like [Durio zibethinus]|uniref:Actin-related protein 9-like n=1 Tax=Durio zibethinus TaxID=66656 RepID=A0A6P5X2S7_DURZI|nr:actin-related protein 9-like [Durio zibethinus]
MDYLKTVIPSQLLLVRGSNLVIINPGAANDISRCLLWTQRHHQTWPQIRTDILTKPIDLLMLNRLKESYCEIQEGELDAVAIVHSYEDAMPAGSHKTRLTALNVS